MAKQAMWVHGHSANIELNTFGRGPGEDINGVPWTSLEGLRVGWGVQYRCQDNSAYWFHLAVPTLAIHNGVAAKAQKAIVLFQSQPGVVSLQSLHIWDGNRRVFVRDGIGITGDFSARKEGQNTFDLPNIAVQSALGICLNFKFADPGLLTLNAAGIEFDV
jgi:hypothetical protein